jgi:hypothetical protein
MQRKLTAHQIWNAHVSATDRNKRVAELQAQLSALQEENKQEGLLHIREIMGEYQLTLDDVINGLNGKAIATRTRKSRGQKSFTIRMKHPTTNEYIESYTDNPKLRIHTMKTEATRYAKTRDKSFRKYESFVGLDMNTVIFETYNN